MDLSQLPKLGKVAGVPGIALGVVALMLGTVVASSGVLPEAWRGPIWVVLVLGVLVLVALVILGWAGGCPGAQIGQSRGDESPVTIVDKSKGGGKQQGTSRGDKSPVDIRRG